MAKIIVLSAKTFIEQKTGNGFKLKVLVDIEVYSQEDYDILKKAEIDGLIDMDGNSIILKNNN